MPAAALYTSPLFRKSLLAALDSCKKAFILSAKHGLLACSDIIEPYDVTLKTLPKAARQAWGERVGGELAHIVDKKTTAVMYCGEEYIAPVRQALVASGGTVEAPLVGRSLGQRLQDLTAINEEVQLRAQVNRFYRMMRLLWLEQGGGRTLGESNGKMDWPRRGVYFITEMPGGLSHGTMPRVVRVGTHAVSAGSRTTLWDRLSTHRGTEAGGGSHRSSIFRSHVGHAIMNKDRLSVWPQTWSEGQSAPRMVRDGEAGLEELVSNTIGQMRVLWLDIPDDAGPGSDRAYIERNAIGLLSRANLLAPHRDPNWLGLYSRDWRICVSGLWNLNHVFSRPNEDFLDRLSEYIQPMIGSRSGLSEVPIKRTVRKTQFELFQSQKA
jgi:hypothetical protein